MECVYTVHHCWKALFEEALTSQDEFIQHRLVNRAKELPSHPSIREYSLFRVEMVNGETGGIEKSAHATSRVFEYLDPKDALYKELFIAGLEHLMPPTVLLKYDSSASTPNLATGTGATSGVSSMGTVVDTFIEKHGKGLGIRTSAACIKGTRDGIGDTRSNRLLLKAALGAGGYGLYFIDKNEDLWKVLNGHKIYAEKREGFIEKLISEYGDVPQWSLQALVEPVRCSFEGIDRKSQIRAYICAVDNEVFLYHSFEVRLPIWENENESCDVVETSCTNNENTISDDIEQILCGNGNARPYNRGRCKQDTMRLMLDEINELGGAYSVVKECCVQFAKHLKTHSCIKAYEKTKKLHKHSSMAIIGVDLLVCYRREPDIDVCTVTKTGTSTAKDKDKSKSPFAAYILEANNNPALPQPSKHRMSDEYHRHMCALCHDLVHLGLSLSIDKHKEMNEEMEQEKKEDYEEVMYNFARM